MKLTVKDIQGKDIGELEVKIPVIANGKGTQAVHDTVVAYNAAQRSGTACTKNAGEVAGTNKKPWRQKGTGRARAGSFQSPLWRGGGVVFGPKPRDFSKDISRGTKKLAMIKAFNARVKAGDVVVVDAIKLTAPKTKEFIGILNTLNIDGTTLVVTQGVDKSLCLATRNVSYVEVTTSDTLNTYQFLRSDKVIITCGALQNLEERLTKE
jgi:large subunit ribosomal protein L4